MSHKEIKVTTEWREYQENGNRYRCRVSYGFTCFPGQAPYWSVTSDTEHFDRRWRESGGGCQHDIVAKVFPELKRAIPWHLANVDGIPMHYIENSMYWLSRIGQKREPHDPDPMQAFKSSSLWNRLNREGLAMMDEPESLEPEAVKQWLVRRMPDLTIAFRGMAEDFGFNLKNPDRPVAPKAPSKAAVDGMTEFARKAGLVLSSEATDHNPNMGESADMDHWKCRLSRGSRRIVVYFSMGSAHQGKPPAIKDLLECLASDCGMAGSSFEQWCRDLGYEVDSRQAKRTHTAVRKQALRVESLLGPDLYRELIG